VTDGDDDLLAASSRDHRTRNGVPTAEQAADRELAYHLVSEVLSDLLLPDGLGCSPLGAAWTDVFEAYVRSEPSAEQLRERGWLGVDRLLDNIGEAGSGHWMVVSDGRVLSGVSIKVGEAGDPVAGVIERALQRHEVRLREVLELRALLRQGAAFPTASDVVRAAADVETGLGGRELVKWTSGRRLPAPVALSRPSRGNRMVVACSGVDGAGKTTLMDGLARDLTSGGVPVSRVWLRPGMGLGWVATLAQRAKRLLGMDPRPGIGMIATDPEAALRSRQGIVGWVWSVLITAMFVAGLRRQYAETRGVVLFDRHVADAFATLDFAYAGSDLRVQRWLARTFIPAADMVFYLDIPPDVALARKPGDMIGASAIASQIGAYQRWLPQLNHVHRLDATEPAGVLAAEALARILNMDRGGTSAGNKS